MWTARRDRSSGLAVYQAQTQLFQQTHWAALLPFTTQVKGVSKYISPNPASLNSTPGFFYLETKLHIIYYIFFFCGDA